MYGDRTYYCHLREVKDSVLDATAFKEPLDDLLQVAWLHDILEDTKMLKETLAVLFNASVVAAVVAMTRIPGEDRIAYLDRCKANSIARIVKIHDSLCNLRASVMRFDQARIRKYTEQINYLAS
jgi:(p)ppGpp synthase/HD superfamily hydrolase